VRVLPIFFAPRRWPMARAFRISVAGMAVVGLAIGLQSGLAASTGPISKSLWMNEKRWAPTGGLGPVGAPVSLSGPIQRAKGTAGTALRTELVKTRTPDQETWRTRMTWRNRVERSSMRVT
jgi:hypothetical protein